MFISSHTGQLRGHSGKLFKCRPRLDIRKYFFSQWVDELWNLLTPDTVSQEKVDALKTNLRVVTNVKGDLPDQLGSSHSLWQGEAGGKRGV